MAKHRQASELIWAYLLHLGYNMWSDRDIGDPTRLHITAQPYLRCDKPLWDELLGMMKQVGVNMVVIDLGEGVQYRSHPELAVRGSWSGEQLRAELAKMRAMGLEPIPKLNFSTAHDVWLGPYARMVSTDTYYRVCADLIAEVSELFDSPRFFHLGMDEETARHQRNYAYAVMRQYDLWWHDLHFLVAQVERARGRAWVWSDYIWEHRDEFLERMPKSVLQSNWYYGSDFSESVAYANAYRDLESHGYDKIPTGSNWSNVDNFPKTVAFAREQIAPERLLGFLQTVWKPTLEMERERHMQALDLIRQGREVLDKA